MLNSKPKSATKEVDQTTTIILQQAQIELLMEIVEQIRSQRIVE